MAENINSKIKNKKATPKSLFLTNDNNRQVPVNISKVELYDYDNNELIKLNFEHQRMQEIFYQGNVDKIVNISPALNDGGYPLLMASAPTYANISDDLLNEAQKYNHYYLQSDKFIDGNFGRELILKFDPINIKFNTTPHLVFGFEPIEFGIAPSRYVYQPILPSVNDQYNLHGIYGKPF